MIGFSARFDDYVDDSRDVFRTPHSESCNNALIYPPRCPARNEAAQANGLTSAACVNRIPHDRLLTSPSGLKARLPADFRVSRVAARRAGINSSHADAVTSRGLRFAPLRSVSLERGNEENRGGTKMDQTPSRVADLSRNLNFLMLNCAKFTPTQYVVNSIRTIKLNNLTQGMR